jgi:hypothetical protein
MRLRIGFETFVASSTFPSSSALVNHQPYALTKAGKIAPQANPVNPGVRTGGKNAGQFAAAITQQFFVLPRTRVLAFSSQENFFRGSKNKIHFFLVDFEAGF